MSYLDKAEITREYYREQGVLRERERIRKLLTEKLGDGDKTWSPVYVISLLEEKPASGANS
jgi:hypothetical protein